MIRPLLLASSCLMLTACVQLVKITPDGDNVAVLPASEVGRCTKTASMVVSVLDRVTVVDRKPARVERDLNTLARNDAPAYGGDTVVPTTDVYNGKRNYDVYRCRP